MRLSTQKGTRGISHADQAAMRYLSTAHPAQCSGQFVEQGHLTRFRVALVNMVMTSCSCYKDISVLCQKITGVQAGSKVLTEKHKSL